MKFWCGENWVGQERRLKKWHRWFAWYPVYIEHSETHGCWFWLEVIERRIESDLYCTYRFYREVER